MNREKAVILSDQLDKNKKIFEFIFTKVFIPFHFMHFRKILEARIVSKYLDLHPGEKICDIACGCEELPSIMARKVVYYTALI